MDALDTLEAIRLTVLEYQQSAGTKNAPKHMQDIIDILWDWTD